MLRIGTGIGLADPSDRRDPGFDCSLAVTPVRFYVSRQRDQLPLGQTTQTLGGRSLEALTGSPDDDRADFIDSKHLVTLGPQGEKARRYNLK